MKKDPNSIDPNSMLTEFLFLLVGLVMTWEMPKT